MTESELSRPVEPVPMSNDAIMKTSKRPRHDWSRFDAMTTEAKRAAALDDPDAQPLAEEDMPRLRRTPRVRVIRQALKLTQEEFSQRFGIPLGTLRDWEQGRKEPDAAARAYLLVIARNPAAVS